MTRTKINKIAIEKSAFLRVHILKTVQAELVRAVFNLGGFICSIRV